MVKIAKPKGKYRSTFEYTIAKQLGDRAMYESISIPYIVPTSKRKYTPDFILDNGIIVECKGRFTAIDRKKMILVREANPTLDIRLLFQNANVRLSRTSKTTYGDWATKNNFIWANKIIPEEWLL